MSPFSRLPLHALCCFYAPQHHNNDESRPSSSAQPVPYVVPRKPIPYAMINVPHEPEMTDIHAFRRLFTASPACPHESTPIGGKHQRPLPKGSLDLGYSFNSGSPVPPPKKSTSIQRLAGHVKQKMSETRLSKSSSRAENRISQAEEVKVEVCDPVADADAILLAPTARSTGLSDLLRSRNGSDDGYDSDARSIKTPQLASVAGTVQIGPAFARKSVNEQEIQPDDSLSNRQPSSELGIRPESDKVSPSRNANSSPLPNTPEKLSFREALQLKHTESPSVALQRLSAGIANGTIRAPSDMELRMLMTPRSGKAEEEWKFPMQAPRRSSSLKQDPDTPQTVVKRLSARIQDEKRVNMQADAQESQRSSLLAQLDSALLEYLSKFEEKRSPDSPQKPISSKEVEQEHQQGTEADQGKGWPISQATSLEHSRADVASLVSDQPSEHQSLHLFNMHISSRLASKSTATMLSPAHSVNASRKSLDRPPPLPVPARSHMSPRQHAACVRAEHNRRPSDPCTRQLFERSGTSLQPYQKVSNTSMDRSKLKSRERDDASSFYTNDDGPLSTTSTLSNLDGSGSASKNINSLAIGGRSASSGVSYRPLSNASTVRTVSRPIRSVSVSTGEHDGRLDAASNVISKYVDGGFDLTRQRPPPSLSKRVQSQHSSDEANSKDNTTTRVAVYKDGQPCVQERHVSQGWLTDGQRTGWNHSFVDSARITPTPKRPSLAPLATSATPSPLAESATDIWNRAWRDATKEHGGPELLSTPKINMDSLHRRSSNSTVRLRHQSSAILHTPETTIRRSQSADPYARQSLHADTTNNSSHVSRTLKRLSFLQLKPSRRQSMPGNGPRKLQKRSAPELAKKQSFSTARHAKIRSMRAGNTPPLKELLGMWGSFPSHDRAQRNGSASVQDNVYTHDFVSSTDESPEERSPHTPPGAPNSSRTRSTMYSALSVLSRRAVKLDRKKAKSMTFPISPRDRVSKNRKLFLGRWRRLYRSKSSEWRGYMITGGHRSSVSAGRPLEYPELECLPGEGMFAQGRWRSPDSYEVDVAGSRVVAVPRVNHDESTPTRGQGKDQHSSQDLTRGLSNYINDDEEASNPYKLLRSGVFASSGTSDPRRFASTPEPYDKFGISRTDLRSSSDAIYRPTPKHEDSSEEATAPYTRKSRDMTMPGAFSDD